MIRTAIIAALPGELKPLVDRWPHESRNGVDIWRNLRNGDEWIAACAGTGVDAALRALAEVEKDGAVHRIFSVGWAGATREEFAAGRTYPVSGVIDATTGERFPIAGRPPGGCWLATADRIADEAQKRRLAACHGASLVDMEAAGIARLAAARGIAFDCIKAVSDGLTDRFPDFNRFRSADGKLQQARFVCFALFRPWFWPALIRLARNSRRAARSIGASLLALLDKRAP